MKKLIFSLFLLSTILGCSSAPDRDDYKKAINEYLEQKPFISTNIAFDFPYKIVRKRASFKLFYNYLSAFEVVGLIEVQGGISEDGTKIVYDLTDKGRRYFRPKSGIGILGIKRNGFYYGNRELIHIEHASKPNKLLGPTTCEVSYTYYLKDPQEWALNQAIQRVDRNIANNVSSAQKPLKAKATLILTKNGWVHQKLLNINKE